MAVALEPSISDFRAIAELSEPSLVSQPNKTRTGCDVLSLIEEVEHFCIFDCGHILQNISIPV